jgi:hypothetical protein
MATLLVKRRKSPRMEELAGGTKTSFREKNDYHTQITKNKWKYWIIELDNLKT